ncbi:QcrA and Rieske domain-containing protein [Tellurirhabdus rosea]|uniref:QcrA and Rieske domain-containing protein n=1 Tax=Tellurirhabdus rosea TaxID=2674997 RepID=UPI0022507316|nr:Rieske 2Fe-2S domain-containing protein [Tellurirhabdus rosea]
MNRSKPGLIATDERVFCRGSMNRNEFLKSMGFRGAALWALLASCQNSQEVTPIGPVDFDLDLSEPANALLLKPGGYVVRNSVVVARTLTGALVAASQVCSHEGQRQITFRNNEFYCTAHGARFDTGGNGLNANGRRGLTVYKVDQKGPIVRVYS